MKKIILYLLGFIIKGWEVSLLLVLPILQTQGRITVFQVGLLAAIFSIFHIISAFLAGHLSEKFGSKKLMTVSILFYGSAWFFISTPLNFWILMMVYSIAGVGSGLFMPLANSAIAQLSNKNRAKELGDFSAFTDLGRVVLSAITAFLIGKFGINALINFGILAVVSTLFLTKIKLFNLHFKDETVELKNIRLSDLLKIKRFVLSILTGMSDSFASSSLYIFIPLLLIPKGIDTSVIGFLTGLFFLGYFLGRIFLGRLADKYGAVKILVISEVLMALLIVYLIFVNTFILASLSLFLLGIFTRGTSPVIRAMVAEAVSEKERFDKAFSLYSFSLNSSSVVSRSVYGFLASSLGIASVFYLSGFVALLTIIPLSIYNKQSK